VATIAQTLTQMADQIRDIVDDVTDVDVQVEDRMILNPTPPCIDMWPADPSLDPTLAGFGEIDGGELFTIRARVSTADQDAGQDLLLALMDDEDPLSIGAALFSDPTLNGWAQTLDVQARTGYVLVPDASGEGALLGCLWTVVVVKGDS